MSCDPRFPDALDEVIARGLAKHPADRFACAAELVQAAARALGISKPESLAGAARAGPDQSARPASDAAATIAD